MITDFSSTSATAEFPKFADIRGLCNFLGSVSLQQKFEAMDIKPSDRTCLSSQTVLQLSGLGQYYSSQTDQCYSSVFHLSFI